MTWQSFFDLSTQDHRHLLATYCVVILINLAVFGRLVYAWMNPRT
jgi:hypothetical protein